MAANKQIRRPQRTPSPPAPSPRQTAAKWSESTPGRGGAPARKCTTGIITPRRGSPSPNHAWRNLRSFGMGERVGGRGSGLRSPSLPNYSHQVFNILVQLINKFCCLKGKRNRHYHQPGFRPFPYSDSACTPFLITGGASAFLPPSHFVLRGTGPNSAGAPYRPGFTSYDSFIPVRLI